MLTGGGALAVYDVWFRAEMVGQEGFATWMSDVCAPRYPAVPKNDSPDLSAAGFGSVWSDTLHRDVPMTLKGLTDYFMTHSERIAAIRDGRESEADQRQFITHGLHTLFDEASDRSLGFGITIELVEAV